MRFHNSQKSLLNRRWLDMPASLMLVALAASFSFAQDGAQYNLLWNLKPNTQFDVTLAQSSTLESVIDTRKRKVDNQLTLVMSWRISAVDDEGTATMTQELKSIKITTNAATGGGIQIDTDATVKLKGANAELIKQIQPLIGSTFEVTMDATGKIQSVSIPEATMENLRKLPGSMQLRQLMSSEGLQKIYGQSLVVLPNGDEGKTKSWKRDASIVSSLGNLTRNDEFTVSGWEADTATLTFQSSLGEPTEAKKTETKIISFEGSGEIAFDRKNGRILGSVVRSEMVTERPYREKKIESTVKTKIETTITPAKKKD